MNKVYPQPVGQCLDNFRSRWIAAFQFLCVLFWTLQPLPRLHTYEPQENWINWSGYWYVDGFEQWIQGAYPDWQLWQDQDADNLPDWADPYPSDYSNNTSWSMSGSWHVEYMDQWFDSRPYATTTPQDSNYNGLPDWYDSNYPLQGANTPWSTTGGYWTAQGVEDWLVWGIYPSYPFQDSDSDGLPDDIDPYPWDDVNGSSVLNYWGGQWWIDGVEQWLGGAESTWIDSDNDGIPDSYDAYPFDATNNSTFWAGNSYRIDGEERWYESQYFATSTYQDSDGDGLPNAIDPYPYNASNVYVEPTAWSGWYWISGIERHLNGIYTEWHDTDQDGIPNSIDPYPNDRHNGTDWFELFNAQSPDSDEDGLPDSGENYYGLNRDSSADANADLDNDGLPNLWEYQNYFNLKDPFTGIEDPDFDTLTNLEEYLHGTDPWLADSDDDGFDDAEEIAAGSHPRHSGSTPITPGNYGTGSSIIDSDGDGIPDDQDAYPTDPTNTPDPNTGPHNPYTPLLPPANLLAMAIAIDTVRLDWTPAVSSRPTSIETSTNGVTWTLQEVVPAGITHLIIPQLNPDQRVHFRARTGDLGGGGSGMGAEVTPAGSLIKFIAKVSQQITDHLNGPSMQVAHTPPPPPVSPPSPHRDLIPRDDYTTPSWLHLQTRFKAIGYNEWLDTDPAAGNSHGSRLNYTLSNHLGTTDVWLISAYLVPPPCPPILKEKTCWLTP